MGSVMVALYPPGTDSCLRHNVQAVLGVIQSPMQFTPAFGKEWNRFPQLLQANAEIAHQLGQYRLLPNPLNSLFCYGAVIRSYIT
jgi:hypothetical protein